MAGILNWWYVPLGLVPSFIWLSYYLRKDVHPEPNRLILRVFLLGMLAAPVAAVIGLAISKITEFLPISDGLRNIIFVYIGIALVEEYIKYYVVRVRILRDPAFDEPTDAMIYLIISALGFAAIENILILAPATLPAEGAAVASVAKILTIRFLSATFFHALASGIVGYFLALAILRQLNRYSGVIMGLLIAVTLHGIYDYAILYLEGGVSGLLIFMMLAGMAVGVGLGFKRLRRICFLMLPLRARRQYVHQQ